MQNPSDISRALVAYLGFKTHSFPQHSDTAVAALFPRQDAEALAMAVRRVLEDLRELQPDWDEQDLLQATQWARDSMHQKHPELNDVALDALAWSFSYGWK